MLQRWLRGLIKSHVTIAVPARHVLEGSNAAMAMEPAQRRVASVSAKVVNVSIRLLRHEDMMRMTRATWLTTTRLTVP